MFVEPGVLGSVVGGKVIRPKKPELLEGKVGLKDEVFLEQVGG